MYSWFHHAERLRAAGETTEQPNTRKPRMVLDASAIRGAASFGSVKSEGSAVKNSFFTKHGSCSRKPGKGLRAEGQKDYGTKGLTDERTKRTSVTGWRAYGG